mmetsp:Transcript_52425/g.152585  ORF Transcript_52425/g.152585 Transcript_52425/m.152585 type:complete len:286 (+) Transcript_52425:360-1217(+)
MQLRRSREDERKPRAHAECRRWWRVSWAVPHTMPGIHGRQRRGTEYGSVKRENVHGRHRKRSGARAPHNVCKDCSEAAVGCRAPSELGKNFGGCCFCPEPSSGGGGTGAALFLLRFPTGDGTTKAATSESEPGAGPAPPARDAWPRASWWKLTARRCFKTSMRPTWTSANSTSSRRMSVNFFSSTSKSVGQAGGEAGGNPHEDVGEVTEGPAPALAHACHAPAAGSAPAAAWLRSAWRGEAGMFFCESEATEAALIEALIGRVRALRKDLGRPLIMANWLRISMT